MPGDAHRRVMADVGEHYRPTGDHPAGVYRVVGAGDPVVLLRVADGDGRRVHEGALERVPAAGLDRAFERAADPDAGFSPARAARDAVSGLYWSVRRLFPF
jgi:hypothetical protein